MSATTKRVEIRDRMTCIVALAIKVSGGPQDRLLWHAGFGETPQPGDFADGERYLSGNIILVWLERELAKWDPYGWGRNPRTLQQAHLWLEAHFDELKDGDVLDVEFILGESSAPKVSDFAE